MGRFESYLESLLCPHSSVGRALSRLGGEVVGSSPAGVIILFNRESIMKYRMQRYYPGFVEECDDGKVFEFDTIEQFKEIFFIKKAIEDPQFSHFRFRDLFAGYDEDSEFPIVVWAIQRDGSKQAFSLGHINTVDDLNFEQWVYELHSPMADSYKVVHGVVPNTVSKRFPKGRINYQRMQSKSKMGKRWVWVYKPWIVNIEPRAIVHDVGLRGLLDTDSYKLQEPSFT